MFENVTHTKSLQSNLGTYLNQSENHFKKQEYGLALIAAEKAQQLSPNSVEVILQIGKIYVMQEKFEDAVQYLEQVDEFAPDNPYKDYYLGRCYYKLGDTQSILEKAAKYLNHAASVLYKESNSIYTLHAGLADTVVALGEQNSKTAKLRYERALIFFDTALETDVFQDPTDSIIAYLYRAQANYGLGNYTQCLDDMKNARIKLNEGAYPNLEGIWEEVCEDLNRNGYGKRVSILMQLKEQGIKIKAAKIEMAELEQLINAKENMINSNNKVMQETIKGIQNHFQTIEDEFIAPLQGIRTSSYSNSFYKPFQTRNTLSSLNNNEERETYSFN